MREIKFRVWDKEQKKFMSYPTLSELLYQDGNYYEAPREEHHVVMQYTGLKDKNGMEIFEGDIVKWAGYQGLVRWVFQGKEAERGTPDRIGSWYFNNGYVVDLENGKYPEDDEDPSWVNLDAKYEVIGNLYENPELLKKDGQTKTQTTNEV